MWRTAKLILACLAVLALCAAPASAADDTKDGTKIDRTSINDLIQQWREERQATNNDTNAADNDRNARRANRLEARTGPVDISRRLKAGVLGEGDQQAEGNPVPGCPWWAAAAGLCENDWWDDKPGVGPPSNDDHPGQGPPGGLPPGQTPVDPAG